VWFRLGGCELHLIANDGWLPPRENPARPQQGPHLALAVDEIEPLRRRLDAAGIATEYPDVGIEGRQRLYCRDPFGNLIEVVNVIAELTFGD
jgi:catechol 2,3-dioxygenase-like lactoylglutathione lyase family enzyme